MAAPDFEEPFNSPFYAVGTAPLIYLLLKWSATLQEGPRERAADILKAFLQHGAAAGMARWEADGDRIGGVCWPVENGSKEVRVNGPDEVHWRPLLADRPFVRQRSRR